MERGACDRVVAPRLALGQLAGVGEQGGAGGGRRAGGGAVDLAVREDDDVAVVAGRDRLVQDRAVDPGEALVLGMARNRVAGQRGLDRAPRRDQRGEVLRDDAQPEARGGHVGEERAAPGDVGLDLAGAHAARHDVGGHVAEGDALGRPGTAVHAGHHAAGRDVDRDVDRAVVGRRDPPGVDGPRAERDRPVPTRGRVAVLVPEQHAEVGAVVVGRDDEAAVHVGVPARLLDEQPPDAVDGLGPGGVRAPFGHGRARDLERALAHDPERLARRVVVGRLDLHGVSATARGARGRARRARRRPGPAPPAAPGRRPRRAPR